MNNFFMTLVYWHWIGLAALLFIIEILTGTGFLLWLGLSSLCVGLLLLLFNAITISFQLILFAFISILTALLWRSYLHYYPVKTDKPKLNKRTEQYLGRVFTLDEPIVNGMGTVRVDDSVWRVQCNEDVSIGNQIRITGADGVILIAEKTQ